MARTEADRTNTAFRLRRRPAAEIADRDLELVSEQVPELEDGHALVRVHLLSVDPTNRIWMSEHRGYMPPVPLDAVMRGIGVGEVIESRREDLAVGDKVLGFTGWQELCLADDAQLEAPLTVLPEPLPAPLGAFLGVLGHTGITAWLGNEIGDPQPGETVVVSAAAGAVGSIAGQIAKARGARVVGIAGGRDKCAHVTGALGFDECVDRRAADWREQLEAATPDGIDFDFENAGGELMDAILQRLNIGARVALCGMIAEYNAYADGRPGIGQLAISQVLMQRASMKGFLVLDHGDRFPEIIGELAALLAAGKLHYDETYVEGLHEAPAALNRLFDGSNVGKQLVRVVAEPAERA